MAASDARPVPRKNTAFRFYFAIRKPSDSTLITTWAGADSEVSLDGAAFADCTNEATEIGTTGCGYIDLTAAEMNADAVVLKVTVTNTGAVPLVFTLFPEEAGDYRADMVLISGDSGAADNAESFFDGTGYAGTGNVIPTVTTLTNLPAITANWLTATGIAADAITAAKIADGAIDTATFASGATLPRVTLVDTCTTNTDMRGTDNAALAATALSTAVWTATIAGRIDVAVSTRLSPLIAGRQIAVAATTGIVTAELDSASRLAIWNTLTTETFTADSFGELLIISDGTNGRAVKVTGANHIAADVHDCQADGLSGSTEIAAINTFATRVTTGLVQDGAVYQFTANMLELGPSGGGGGDATLAKQTEILAAIQGSEVIQVASPNVSGNLVLTQGDDYDGVANPKASWTVTTDYTSGWTVRLTIRSAADAVIYTNTGSVVSSTVVAVTIAAPTGLTMTGCPGQWQGKFDVELTHSSGKKKTIALGTCYINEDQTR